MVSQGTKALSPLLRYVEAPSDVLSVLLPDLDCSSVQIERPLKQGKLKMELLI